MANLPDSLYEDYSKLNLTSSSSASSSAPPPIVVSQPNQEMIVRWINDLHSQNLAESDFALQNLANQHRNNFEILPLLLWDSHGTVRMLLQEVISAYRHIVGHMALPFFPPLNPPRVYNVLLLFQRITDHSETRSKFLKAKMPNYFYPFMDIGLTDKPYERLRLGALGVIAHMLKAPLDGAAIRFLMDTGVFNYCIKPIEFGSTEAKTLAVFILHKIMSTDEGLQYCCVLVDRFFVIDDLLKKLLVYLSAMTRPSSSLFNLVVACYVKLSQKSRARDGLRRYTPVLLFDGTFTRLLVEDTVADNYWKQLVKNLNN